MKKVINFIVLILLCSSLCACQKNYQNLDCSNLNTTDNQKILKKLFNDNGISQDDYDALISDINQYNAAISTLLTHDGFFQYDTNKDLYEQYDDISMVETLDQKEDIVLNNCRMTAYQIMHQTITINHPNKADGSDLFVDHDYLSQKGISNKDIKNFDALFSSMKTINSKNINDHYQIIKQTNNDLGICFNNDKIKLIRVYIHSQIDDENSLMVGHTGVLIPYKTGFFLVEKLSFQMPYQIIYFNTTDTLKEYLNKLYNVEYGQNTAPPIILSNNDLL